MEKKKRKLLTGNAVRMLLFLCIAAGLVSACNNIFSYADHERSNTIMDEFYEQDRDTVDIVYFGSSATQRAYIIPKAFHEDGIAAYSIATGSQPFVLTKYLMKETLKTQKPKLFIVDLRRTCDDKNELWDVAVRRIVDNMKFSKNKVDTVQAVLEFADGGENGIDETGSSYLFPLLKYHSRWNPSKWTKYSDTLDYYKGYTIDPVFCFSSKKAKSIPYNDSTAHITEESEKVLNDLLDYCDQIDTEVLFLVSPYACSEYGMQRINYAQDIVEERGYTVLNFLPPEKKAELGLDDRYCYYNHEHLNYYGSELYTRYLTDYIKANYDIPDRRGDERYASWEEEYERFANNLDTTYSESYNKMMQKVNKYKSGDK